MTRDEFLRILEEGFELEPHTLAPSQQLADLSSWDSMSALVFMALADEKAGVSVTGNQLVSCETVGDLLDLLGDKLTA
jgi:acyl carrier protein